MAGLTAAMVVSVATGFALASRVIVDEGERRRAALLLAIALAVGMGLGASACAFFVWTALLGPTTRGFVAVEIVLLAALVVAVRRTLLEPLIRRSPSAGGPARRPIGRGWRLAVSASVVASVVLFLARSASLPHGEWDAWMTWNVAARFLFRGGAHWQDAFAPSFRHPDYPLLVPGAVARLWTYMGADSAVAPAAIAALFTFATVALAGAALAALRTGRQAILGILILLATPSFLVHGASQYADTPLSFFLLAGVVLLFLHDRARDPWLLALAGAAVGLGAWTKNEGLLFLASFVVVRCVVLASSHGWRSCLGELRWFGLGLTPALLIVVYFKLHLAPANDYVAGQGLADTLARLLEAERYLAVARVFKLELANLGDSGLVGALPLLIAYLLCVGLKVDETDRAALATAVGAVILVLIGYSLVLVTAPGDFLRLLNRSVDRLLLHVWPAIVFTCFMVARPPEAATND